MSTKGESSTAAHKTDVDDEPVIITTQDYQDMDEDLPTSYSASTGTNDSSIEKVNEDNSSDKDDVEENDNDKLKTHTSVSFAGNKEEDLQGYSVFDEPVMVSSNTSRVENAHDDYKNLDDYDEPYDTQMLHDRVKPKRQCNDAFWGVLFIVDVSLMIFYLGLNVTKAIKNAKEIPNYFGTLVLVLALAIIATILSTFALSTMMKYADTLVKTALTFSISFSLIIGCLGFIFGQIGIGLIGFICFIISICYAKVVWHRIPYGAANLRTAITAVRQNFGTIILAYQIQVAAFLFTLIFLVAVQEAIRGKEVLIVFFSLFSFYWVHQVCKNMIHVTVAGTISTWWYFSDESSKVLGEALSDSFCRASTYTFGSVCFGSCLVAIIRGLCNMTEFARQNDDLSSIVCCFECLLRGIDHIVQYFNKWAYVYVGVYGHSFLDSGRNVLTLFEQKGWTVLVTDDLVDNVLFMISIGIGLLTALVGWAITRHFPEFGVAIGNPVASGFLVGFLIGYLSSSIMMGVVGSAVNTVIVCYIESPREFSENNPILFAEMRAAWQKAWPEEF